MYRSWMKVSAVPLLAAVLWVSGCADQSLPSDRLLGPDAVSFAKGNVEKRLKIKPVKGKLPAGEKIERKDIGPGGGELKVAGHVLIVPEGAVDRKTRFTMRVFTNTVDVGMPGAGDNQVHVGVELRATRYDCDNDGIGEKVKAKGGCDEQDIGAAGFKNKVRLQLSYAWATNVGDSDQVAIYWLKSNKEAVPFTTVMDKSKSFATAELEHFSDYLLAMP